MLKKLLPHFKNKYVLTLLIFITWMLFFDRNDIISQIGMRSKLNQMKQDKLYYTEEIEKNKKEMEELMTNPKTLEKFAREKYLMKRDDEDIFVIVYTNKDE